MDTSFEKTIMYRLFAISKLNPCGIEKKCLKRGVSSMLSFIIEKNYINFYSLDLDYLRSHCLYIIIVISH